MKIAIVGSRKISNVDIGIYVPVSCDEIITGGAKGVDTLATRLAEDRGIELTIILPEYVKYKRAAPLLRNKIIVDMSDEVIAFWDGKSRGTRNVIEYCKKQNKKYTVVLCECVCK